MDARTLLPGAAMSRGRRIDRPRPRPRLGLTLIELLLGLAITSLVGLGVTMILVSASYGTTSQKELRSLAVRHKTIAARFDAALRASRKVLAAGDDYIVLWIADLDDSENPKVSELRRIERDDVTNELRAYKASATIAPADDTEFDLATTDFDLETNAIKGTADFPLELWGTGLTEWELHFDDDAAPQDTLLVSYRLTVTLGNESSTAVGAATLRNDL